MSKSAIEKLKSLIKEADNFIPDAERAKTDALFSKNRNVAYESYTSSVTNHLKTLSKECTPYMMGYSYHCLPLKPHSLLYTTDILKRLLIALENGSLGVGEVVDPMSSEIGFPNTPINN